MATQLALEKAGKLIHKLGPNHMTIQAGVAIAELIDEICADPVFVLSVVREQQEQLEREFIELKRCLEKLLIRKI